MRRDGVTGCLAQDLAGDLKRRREEGHERCPGAGRSGCEPPSPPAEQAGCRARGERGESPRSCCPVPVGAVGEASTGVKLPNAHLDSGLHRTSYTPAAGAEGAGPERTPSHSPAVL